MEGQWRQVAVPPFCERMIGFSVPQDRMVLAISYEGMHVIQLGDSITIETDDAFNQYDCYNPDTGIAKYRGTTWKIIGLHAGSPLMRSPCNEELRLDSDGLRVSVFQDGTEQWSSSFENFSGDWVAATFSPDGKIIVLGCPYDFDFRVWRRDQSPNKPLHTEPRDARF
jgi:hypothetical protein